MPSTQARPAPARPTDSSWSAAGSPKRACCASDGGRPPERGNAAGALTPPQAASPPAAGGGDPTATDEATRIFEAECETLASTSGTAGENADRLSSSPTRTDRLPRGYPGAGTGSSAALRRHRPALRAGGCPPGRDRSPAVPTCRTRGVE